jgi:hypothetical protein
MVFERVVNVPAACSARIVTAWHRPIDSLAHALKTRVSCSVRDKSILSQLELRFRRPAGCPDGSFVIYLNCSGTLPVRLEHPIIHVEPDPCTAKQ